MTDAAPATPAITPISKAIRQTLRAEIKRTGITALMLLKDAQDIPDGLNAAHINRWIGGITIAALTRHVRYVTDRWAALPDNARRSTSDGASLPRRGRRIADDAERIAVTQAMSQSLRAELARTGIDHATMLQHAENPPPGLTTRIVRGWLYRDAATTNAEYWDFVMTRLGASPDLSTPLPGMLRKPRKKLPRPRAI